MQEKSHAGAHSRFPQGRRRQHEVVVVDPDKVVFLRGFRDHLGELAIHLLIGLPVLGIEIATRRHVVKQRPDDFIGEAGIKLCDIFFGERDRPQSVGAAMRGPDQQRFDGFVRAGTGPTDPDSGLVAPTRFESRGQSSGTSFQTCATRMFPDKNRQPVRNVDHASLDFVHPWPPEARSHSSKNWSSS